MSNGIYPLDTIQVASPCDASWEDMPGDERVRLCPQCRQHVFNLSALTRREAEDLLRRMEGRMCVRLYRRADDTVLTSDCPVGVRALRRARRLLAGSVAALVLALVGWVAGLAVPARGSAGRATAPRMPQPFQAILDWLAPPPPVMGAICVPPPSGATPNRGSAGEGEGQDPNRSPEAQESAQED